MWLVEKSAVVILICRRLSLLIIFEAQLFFGADLGLHWDSPCKKRAIWVDAPGERVDHQRTISRFEFPLLVIIILSEGYSNVESVRVSEFIFGCKDKAVHCREDVDVFSPIQHRKFLN